MIGVDTNVLLRLFIIENPEQNALAAAFFAERSPVDPAYISIVVMAEFAWVLKKTYGYAPEMVCRAIQAMLDSNDFIIQHRDIAEWAVDQFNRANLAFSDLL